MVKINGFILSNTKPPMCFYLVRERGREIKNAWCFKVWGGKSLRPRGWDLDWYPSTFHKKRVLKKWLVFIRRFCVREKPILDFPFIFYRFLQLVIKPFFDTWNSCVTCWIYFVFLWYVLNYYLLELYSISLLFSLPLRFVDTQFVG